MLSKRDNRKLKKDEGGEIFFFCFFFFSFFWLTPKSQPMAFFDSRQFFETYHGKISTNFILLINAIFHGPMLPKSPEQKFDPHHPGTHASTPPKPPTNSCYQCYPRYLVDFLHRLLNLFFVSRVINFSHESSCVDRFWIIAQYWRMLPSKYCRAADIYSFHQNSMSV